MSSYYLSFESSAEQWLDTEPDKNLVWHIHEWLMDVCSEPHPFNIAVQLFAEAAPRRYAVVPGTDVIVTFVIVEDDENPAVRILKFDHGSGPLWTP